MSSDVDDRTAIASRRVPPADASEITSLILDGRQSAELQRDYLPQEVSR
jgi:hypothetical protein